MHGRLKVKTTAEQEEAKRKEREKKLKLYLVGTAKTFEKRAKKEYDVELLSVTGDLLSANPDFYSLWNVRREVLTHLRTNETSEVQSHFQSELLFLEQCLRINPKSYGTWHHRSWVLDNMPEADWQRELQLCNKFLEYDERNFHCWDYRRFVVHRSDVAAEQELAYTTDKIESNFSNYSSWHYRSKLLPLVHEDPNHPIGVQEEQLLQESMLAQNAFFTDPNDQSAWFYHRWLLGRALAPLRLECVHISRSQHRIIVGISQTIQLDDVELTVFLDGSNVATEWFSPNKETFCSVWTSTSVKDLSSFEGDVTIHFKPSGSDAITQTLNICPQQEVAVWKQYYKTGTRFCHELSAVTSDVLTQELESLQQLHDLEPDNKWVLLTMVSLMRAVDPLKYEGESNSSIDKLICVDPMRTNYYLDLKSKFTLENSIEQHSGLNPVIDLSNKDLTSFVHAEHLVTMEMINLSHNSIVNMKGAHCLQCLKVLNMDGNKMVSCDDFQHLTLLQELSLCENNITCLDDIHPLEKCTQLKKLNLKGNPLTKEIKDGIMKFLPGVVVSC